MKKIYISIALAIMTSTAVANDIDITSGAAFLGSSEDQDVLVSSKDTSSIMKGERVTYVSYSRDAEPLSAVLRAILSPYGVSIAYDYSANMDIGVYANLRDMTLEDAINKLLAPMGYSFSISAERMITVSAYRTKIFELPFSDLESVVSTSSSSSGKGKSDGGNVSGKVSYSSKMTSPIKDFKKALEEALKIPVKEISSGKAVLPSVPPSRTNVSGMNAQTPPAGGFDQGIMSNVAPQVSGLGKVKDFSSVVVFTEARKVIVRGNASQIELAEKIIKDFKEFYSYSVIVDLEIAELNENASRKIGISTLLNNGGRPIGGIMDVAAPVSGAAGGLATSNSAIGGLISAAFNVHSGGAIVSTISALETTGDAKVLARPTLHMLNGYSQEFKTGRETQFIGEITSQPVDLVNPTVQAQPTVTWEKVLDGLSVTVRSTVKDKKTVELLLKVDSTSLVGTTVRNVQGQAYEKPILETKSTTTLTKIAQGESVVLAGLISTTSKKDDAGLPFLSKVPLLSLIFGTTSKVKSNRELVIIATPRIVRVR